LGFDARLIEVRSLGHSRPDLLTLSSSRFDPYATLAIRDDSGLGDFKTTAARGGLGSTT